MISNAPLSRRGFSLLENLVAITLVATFLPVMMVVLVGAYRAVAETSAEQQSAELATLIFSDLPHSWEGGGKVFSDPQTFPSLGNTEGLSFHYYENGVPLLIDNPEQPQGEGVVQKAGLVATIKEDADARQPGSGSFILEVSGPAGRPMSARWSFIYERRFRVR